MKTITIIVQEISPGRHQASLPDGNIIVRASSAPFCAGARALIAMGLAPSYGKNGTIIPIRTEKTQALILRAFLARRCDTIFPIDRLRN